MKALITASIFSFIFGISLNAQESATISYEFRTYGGYRSVMQLHVNKGKSSFIYQKENTRTQSEDGDMEFYHYFEYYNTVYNMLNGTVTEQRTLADGTKLKATWQNDLKWEITEETGTFKGYKVQKAVAESHEAVDKSTWEYYGKAVAWFTMDIPFSTGPERYFGLPGLIVKLEFTERTNITFTMTDISFTDVPEIVLPKEGIEVSKAQIMRPGLISKKWLKEQANAQPR